MKRLAFALSGHRAVGRDGGPGDIERKGLSPQPRRQIPSLLVAVLVAVVGATTIAGAPASADVQNFTNTAQISIPGSGTASPYPSTINVAGMQGQITDVTVGLRGYSHSSPLSVDVLLVSPNGTAAIVMSDACGFTGAVNNLDLTFNESAPGLQHLPFGYSCTSGAYRPTDYGSGTPDAWPNAPAVPPGANFNRFIGGNPNGAWKLYVVGAGSPQSSGKIAEGWVLTIRADVPDAFVPNTGTSGIAGPYPIVRTVNGMSGVIADVDVSLEGIFHTRPDDLDLLLVGPNGMAVMLMSDACGESAATGQFWRWDDGSDPMPDAAYCATGTYRPTDHEPGEQLPRPAPAGPYGTSLSVFDATDPNGEWRLFAYDDQAGGSGFFVNRFNLYITTRPPAAVAFTHNTVDVSEGETVELTLARLSGLGAGTVTVTTAPLSATAGTDFTPVSTTVEFAAGELQKTVAVETIADALAEGPETFAVGIVGTTGDAEPAQPAEVVVTIHDPAPDPEPHPDPDNTAPDTEITKGPKKKTFKRKTTFRFTSNESGARFDCKLDRRVFKPCSSPHKITVKRRGRHTFSVRAIDAAGNVDTTPATYKWKVKKRNRR